LELVSCHPAGVWNFEVASSVFKSLWFPVRVICCLWLIRLVSNAVYYGELQKCVVTLLQSRNGVCLKLCFCSCMFCANMDIQRALNCVLCRCCCSKWYGTNYLSSEYTQGSPDSVCTDSYDFTAYIYAVLLFLLMRCYLT
jgi:hypothetical protein